MYTTELDTLHACELYHYILMKNYSGLFNALVPGRHLLSNKQHRMV